MQKGVARNVLTSSRAGCCLFFTQGMDGSGEQRWGCLFFTQGAAMGLSAALTGPTPFWWRVEGLSLLLLSLAERLPSSAGCSGAAE